MSNDRNSRSRKHQQEGSDISTLKNYFEAKFEELQNDIKQVLTQQNQFISEISELKKENTLKDAKITELESKVDQLEQYTRLENVIISNLPIKQSSFANTVKVGTQNESEIHDPTSVKKQVVTFMKSKGIEIEEADISACHPLGRKTPNRDIIVRCVSRQTKEHIMYKVKKERVLSQDEEIYISEHLTKKNMELAAIGRKLKKQQVIQHSWVRDGRIFIRTKGATTEEERIIIITDKNTYLDLGFKIDDLFKK